MSIVCLASSSSRASRYSAIFEEKRRWDFQRQPRLRPFQKASAPERGCRPSLSSGYKCPGERQAGANQYSTETLAWAHCPAETVVWANTKSDVYHFRGTYNYGNTQAGAYMCEKDSLAEGMRAAKNEKHP